MQVNRFGMKSAPVLALLMLASPQVVEAADLATLFTTPAERQIINANRYRRDEEKPRPVEPEKEIETPIQQLIMEDVIFEYRISGITVSSDGAHTVWINSLVYEDGGKLDDDSAIKVITGNEVKVRITAPDGKHYFATSGETLEITYQKPMQN